MNTELTTQLSASDSDKLSLILTTVQSLTVRFDNIDSRLTNFDSRLLRVDEAVHELQEGQRQLQEHQRQLQEGQRHLAEGQEAIRSDVQALRHDVNYRFRILSGTTNAEIRSLDARVTRLELNQRPPKPQT
jgi:predicted  nucleic acid-binding Zn-ribbon protein